MTESLETTPLAGICKMKKDIHLGAFRKKKKKGQKPEYRARMCFLS